METLSSSEATSETPEAESVESDSLYNVDLSRALEPDPSIGLFSIIRSFLSQLSSGRPLYRYTLPIVFIQPVSQLERVAHHAAPNEFLDGLTSDTDPLERLIGVFLWQLATWTDVNRPGLNASKAFNPILGETFQCQFHDSVCESTTYYIAEQVSHHPPVTAFHCENPTTSFSFSGSLSPRLTLGFNSLTVEMKGIFGAIIGDTTFEIEFPPTCAAGFLRGGLRVEVFDWLRVRDIENGIRVEVRFLYGSGGEFEGKILNSNDDTLRYINGNIESHVCISETETERRRKGTNETLSLSLEKNGFRNSEMRVRSLTQQLPTESRRVWLPVTQSLLDGRDAEAWDRKNEIEEVERVRRREEGLRRSCRIFEPVGRLEEREEELDLGLEEELNDDASVRELKWRIRDNVRVEMFLECLGEGEEV